MTTEQPLTWVPLVVALVVVVISTAGSYLTAMRTTSKAARLELLAAKRVAYARALGALTHIVHQASLPDHDRQPDMERERVHEALAQIAVLGSPKLRDFAVDWPDIAEHLFNDWSGLQQNLLDLMHEDLRQSEGDLFGRARARVHAPADDPRGM